MSYPITHVVVQNTPPPNHTVVIGHLYSIPQHTEEVFRTVSVEEDDEVEAKVVSARRGRRPKANEAAETK